METKRTKMTKRLLKESLLELMEQKPFSKISVTAICETAEVHRSTFYAHYEDQSQLLHDIENDIFEKMPAHDSISDIHDVDKFISLNAEFFEYVKSNVRMFKILLIASESTNFRTRLTEWLQAHYYWNDLKRNEQYNRFQRIYISTGAVGMLEEWIKSDFPISSREFSELLLNIIIDG